MSRNYITANGTEITEEMIDTWCEAYEKGELPGGGGTIFMVRLFMVCLHTQTKSLQFFKLLYPKA